MFSLLQIPYSKKSMALSSVLGRYALIKRLLRSPLWFEQSIQIGLDNPGVVSPRWVKAYLSQEIGYVSGHAAYSDHLINLLREKRYKIIQVIRHPGAFIYSWSKYIEEPGYYWNEARQTLLTMGFDQRLEFMITGGKYDSLYYPGIREILQRAEGWYLQEDVQVVRFEDLIGPEGGGDSARQDWIISELLNYLGMDWTPEDIDYLKGNLFGGTVTFRVGKINQWRKDMHPETYRSLMAEISSFPFLKELGYTD